MLNLNQIQRKIFNHLISGNKVYYCDLNESIAVSTDGCTGYVIPKQLLAINTERFVLNEYMEQAFCKKDGDKEVKPTKEMESMDNKSKDVIRKFTGGNFSIWVNERFCNDFRQENSNGITFFAASPFDRILVCDELTKSVVGLILPIRKKE